MNDLICSSDNYFERVIWLKFDMCVNDLMACLDVYINIHTYTLISCSLCTYFCPGAYLSMYMHTQFWLRWSMLYYVLCENLLYHLCLYFYAHKIILYAHFCFILFKSWLVKVLYVFVFELSCVCVYINMQWHVICLYIYIY